MKAILVKGGKGNASDMYIEEVPKPTPKPGQIIVKVAYFGLNRMDISQRMGLYPLPPGAPEIMGVEFSGTVDEVGEKSDSEILVGHEVLGLTVGGAYAEYVAAYAAHCIHKPTDMSWEKAAGVMENWITSYQALIYIAKFGPGQSVLVHGGASGIAVAVMQLAHLFKGSRIFTTVSSEEKMDFVKKLHNGPTDVINYKAQDFAEEIRRTTGGKGVDVIIDYIGQSYFKRNIESLALDGRMVLLSFLSGTELPAGVSLAPLIMRRLSIYGSLLRPRSVDYQTELISLFKKEVFSRFTKSNGEDRPELDIYIHKVYPWQDIAKAHEEMETSKTMGKIIVQIN